MEYFPGANISDNFSDSHEDIVYQAYIDTSDSFLFSSKTAFLLLHINNFAIQHIPHLQSGHVPVFIHGHKLFCPTTDSNRLGERGDLTEIIGDQAKYGHFSNLEQSIETAEKLKEEVTSIEEGLQMESRFLTTLARWSQADSVRVTQNYTF